MEIYLILGGENEVVRPRCNACLVHARAQLDVDKDFWLHTKILCSGQRFLTAPSRIPESVLMREYLIANGIPHTVILTEEQSLDTLGNFVFSYPIIESFHPSKVFLVTDNSHMVRASRVFSTIFGSSPQLELVPSKDVGSSWRNKIAETVTQFTTKHPDAMFWKNIAEKINFSSSSKIEYVSLALIEYDFQFFRVHDFASARKYLQALPVYGNDINSMPDSAYAAAIRKLLKK